MSETRRKLRARAERRQYKDLPDDEIDEAPSFSLDEKLKCPRFGEINLVKEMKGGDLSFQYFEQNGFDVPILVKEQKGLNMKVPNSKTFYVKDVERFVGPDRRLDVMDVKTQKNLEMTLKEWCDYFLTPTKKELLNVISLEFSHTELADKVEPPYVIKQLDWVNTVWPQFLKLRQRESTNAIEEMFYPKVQKYCLMSVKNCYTDFHIDFGGTSVWYHILRGKKVFWLIPPTPLNMELYEQWVLSGKQSHLFFGDTVEHCCRVTLYSGQTFFIPSGWIHAVFTPEDSLVFGGNFLFSCSMESQIKIAQLETTTKVPTKFRYPFFNEIHWYVLANYLECLTGRCYLTTSNDGTPLFDKQNVDEDNKQYYTQSKWNLKEKDVYLKAYESNGLKLVVKYLSKLPKSKQSVPALITNALALLSDAKQQLITNSKQYEEAERLSTLSSTSHPVLYWLCKINYESYLQKLLANSNYTQSKSNHESTSSTSANNNLTSPLKSWGSGLQNTVNTKFIAYKNKLNLAETEIDQKQKIPTTAANINPQSNEMPNSFEKLIAATDINPTNKKQSTKASSTSTNVIINSTIPSSTLPTTLSTVNNVYLTHPSNSSSMVKPTTTVVPNVTSMNIYPNNPNLIMNRPMFNGPLVQSNLQPGIICTNPTATPGLQPNLYAPMQPGLNSFNYNLISNTPMLLTAPQQIDNSASGNPMLLNKNQQPMTANKFGSTAWLQPTNIQQQIPFSQPNLTKQSNLATSTVTTTMKNNLLQQQSSTNKLSSSKSSYKQQQQQSNKTPLLANLPPNIPTSTAAINQQTIPLNHPHSTGSTIIPQLGQPMPIASQAYHQNAPFLSTKTPVNNAPTMFNLTTDPNRPNQSSVVNPNPVINFAGQPTAGFLAPALNPLNQNFIIAPVSSNLISNQIYPNFIGNVLPGNMLVQTNPALNHPTLATQSSMQQQPAIQQQSAVVIGKPTIKLQRMNCRKCKTCTRNSCGLCSPCLDYFSKFGHYPPANNISYSGQISSEICLAKKCLNPVLPYAAVCCACGKSGWHNLMVNSSNQQIMQLESKCNLLECDTCNQIVHLDCVRAYLPPNQKSNEGRMNSHLANSWTCPVCVPIKDREEKNKLDSSLAKTKQVASSTSNKQELINNQHHSKSLTRNVEISDNTKSDKQRQSDHQTASKQQTINRDQSKSSFSVKSAIVSSKATYSNNSADHSTNSNRKEVYDFDDELDEQPNKFGKLSNKQKNDNLSTSNKNIGTKKTASITSTSSFGKKSMNSDQQSNIKLPPKKMTKSKFDDQESGPNYGSEDKLLLLATTSCQKSPIEKLSTKQLEQSKLSKQLSADKKKSLSKEQDEQKSNQTANKANKPSTPTVTSPTAQLNSSNKSRNKQMQSVRGRLEQQLKFLKKKTDSKNVNLSAYRKFTGTKLSTSTTGGVSSIVSTGAPQLSSNQTSNATATTSNSLNKDTVVANCLKNDCILYPNSSKDKDKDALLNKFKNLSSTSIDTSFSKEDSSDSSLGKLEIDTNLESQLKALDKSISPRTAKPSAKNDNLLNSPSNKHLYECESNAAKALPMSYSIEKLASSTSIINKPLEPVPPSTFSSFETGLQTDSSGTTFGDKFKKQDNLFPNLNRFSSGFSNWSNAFAKQNQDKQTSPSFNYTSNTSVFGAFSRNPSTTFSSIAFGLNSPFKSSVDVGQSSSDKKQVSKLDLEKDYYTSTDDEVDDKKSGQLNSDNDDTDLDEEVQRVINEQLMSDDDEEEEEEPKKKSKNVVKKKGKTAKKSEPKVVETSTKKAGGKKATSSIKQTSPSKAAASKRVKNTKTTGKSTKKQKAVESEDDEQLTEEEEIIKPTKQSTSGKGKKGKQASPVNSKNRASLNASSASSTNAKKGKQAKKTSPVIKSTANRSTAKQGNKSKSKAAAASASTTETTKQRKSEIEKLLDQSSDSPTDFMFTDDVYETIADKVKRNLGRKSKIVAAAAVSALSLPPRQFESLITSTPKQTATTKSAAKNNSSKNLSKASDTKKTSTKSTVKQPAPKDDETDLDSDVETNEDSSFEETSKKSTSRNTSGSASKKRKLKSSETSSPSPAKRKSGRGKK